MLHLPNIGKALGYKKTKSGIFIPPGFGDSLVLWNESFETDIGVVNSWPDSSGFNNPQTSFSASQDPTTTGAGHSKWGFGLLFDGVNDGFGGGPAITKNYRAYAIAFEPANSASSGYLADSSVGTSMALYKDASNHLIHRYSDNGTSFLAFGISLSYHYVIVYEDWVANSGAGAVTAYFDGSNVLNEANIGGGPPSNLSGFSVNNAFVGQVNGIVYTVMAWESDSPLNLPYATINSYLSPT